jgi:deazaflavin-dependent oxidoreductase (nitroreductase family)
MRRLTRWLAILATLGGATWLNRARRRARATDRALTDVMKVDVREFVTHRFDPLVIRLGLVGGRVSPWAVLEHVGRTSGTIRRTPVYPRLRDDFMFIPLPYGADTHWVQNILAAGHCRIQQHETIYALDEPAIVAAAENTTLSLAVHRVMDPTRARYLRLHVLDRAPGTFRHALSEPIAQPSPEHLPELQIVHPAPTDEREPAPATDR